MKVYRSVAPAVGGGVGAVVFFFIGIAMLLPSSGTAVSGGVVGGLVLTFSIILGSAVATNRMIVTDEGITCWHTLRKRTIPWSSIRSFGVGGRRGLLPWPGLVINLTSGRVRIDSVVGPRSFVEKVAAELRSFQQAR